MYLKASEIVAQNSKLRQRFWFTARRNIRKAVDKRLLKMSVPESIRGLIEHRSVGLPPTIHSVDCKLGLGKTISTSSLVFLFSTRWFKFLKLFFYT